MSTKEYWFPTLIRRASRFRRFCHWLAALLALSMLAPTPMLYPVRSMPVYAATTSTAAAAPNPADLKGVMWMTKKWQTGTDTDWTGMESDLQDISNAGIGWVRIGVQEGTPFSFYDQLMPLIAKYHIKVLALVLKSYPENDLGTVTQQAAYCAWLAQVVTRYRSTIQAWEIQNEENLPQEWVINGAAGSDPVAYSQSVANYVSLLRQAYMTIKAIDPSLLVVLGGLSEANSEKYVDELVRQNAYQYFDIFGYHPYGRNPTAIVSRVNSIKSHMALQAAFAAKSIWVTEIGFNTEQSWASAGKVATEDIKADFLLQTLQLLSEISGVQRPIFWYTFAEVLPSAGFGLVFKDVTQTPVQTQYLPAYTAYKNLWVTQFVRIVPASEDDFVSKTYPTANYGTANILRIGYGSDIRKAYLKFDLTGLAGTTLQKVQFGFLVSNQVGAGSVLTQTIQMMATPTWTEKGINYGSQPEPIVGLIANTNQALGYQTLLDAATIQRAVGGPLSLEIGSRDADELVIQSREWTSDPPRLIIYYATTSAAAATGEQAKAPTAEALEAIQTAPASPASQIIEIPQDPGDANGTDDSPGDSKPRPQIYLPDVQR